MSAVAGAAAATASSAPPRPSELGSGGGRVRRGAMRATRRWRRGRISWPERRRRRRNAAVDTADVGEDSGAPAPFRQAELGEEVEGATAEIPASVDLTGEERSGCAVWRHRRQPRRRAGERKGGGGFCGSFYREVLAFLVIFKLAPRLAFSWTAG